MGRFLREVFSEVLTFEPPNNNAVYKVTIYKKVILDLETSLGLSYRISKHFFLTTHIGFGVNIMTIDKELVWQINPSIDHFAINFMKIHIGATYFLPMMNKKEGATKAKTI